MRKVFLWILFMALGAVMIALANFVIGIEYAKGVGLFTKFAHDITYMILGAYVMNINKWVDEL